MIFQKKQLKKFLSRKIRLCRKINFAVRAQICVRFVLKKLESYRDNLKIFLNKDDVKVSAKCMSYFVAETQYLFILHDK